MLTLADRFTLARIVFAPVIVVCYLVLPAEPVIAFWVVGLLCGMAEATDWLDGKVARARREVSDFGKLADPFCDVFYRLAVFLVFLLPIGGTGYVVSDPTNSWWQPLTYAVRDEDGLVGMRTGLIPFLPVVLMCLREIVAGALRSMAATKGLVLAARLSGKIKAWMQGFAIISIVGLPAVCFERAMWQLHYATVVTWLCAALSVYSICEYIWTNRAVLTALATRRPMLQPDSRTAGQPDSRGDAEGEEG